MVDDSFAEFYEQTRHRVGAFLYAMCGDRAEAQDTAQEAYVKAWQRWPAVSPEERHAVVLHHLLDLPVTAVAAETGVSANTVKARLVRGRRSLAALLGQDIPEEATHA
ncbi:RNA polymerase sigma factor [Rugosimonospora africana]|uniref:RNA polymerase sigma24 factor n=1 Tax=Rugosimonospora africana TaxID=556532 RepID=A0A8J3QR01_9ACTN|nr:sigma factor-like helix-turn-helix DNA-binding protein [Rugosimonospora africana]GIH15273.1 RNA polymerase sigma24 factor [Rugosimonospora africana]